MLLTLLLACAGPADTDPVETDLPSEYIYDEESTPEPELTEAEVGQAIEEAIDQVLSLHALPVMDGYLDAMEDAGSTCPDYYESDGNVYWYDTCSAETGAEFSGYAFYTTDTDLDDGNGGTYDVQSLYGVAEITTSSGATFLGGGGAYTYANHGDGYEALYSSVTGSFAWDGDSAAQTWLDAGLVPDLEMYLADYDTYGVRAATLDGGVTGFGGVASTVVFADVAFADGWYSCLEEPQGSILVRDANGGWYDVLFDGEFSEGEEVDPAVCDGCGSIWFNGEEVGEACLDFSALTDFEGDEW